MMQSLKFTDCKVITDTGSASDVNMYGEREKGTKNKKVAGKSTGNDFKGW